MFAWKTSSKISRVPSSCLSCCGSPTNLATTASRRTALITYICMSIHMCPYTSPYKCLYTCLMSIHTAFVIYTYMSIHPRGLYICVHTHVYTHTDTHVSGHAWYTAVGTSVRDSTPSRFLSIMSNARSSNTSLLSPCTGAQPARTGVAVGAAGLTTRAVDGASMDWSSCVAAQDASIVSSSTPV